jgi:hypothetical protein
MCIYSCRFPKCIFILVGSQNAYLLFIYASRGTGRCEITGTLGTIYMCMSMFICIYYICCYILFLMNWFVRVYLTENLSNSVAKTVRKIADSGRVNCHVDECVYICICVCIFTYLHAYWYICVIFHADSCVIHTFVHMYMYMYMYVHICVYVYIYIYVCECVYACTCICTCTCTCKCVCVYVHIHLYISHLIEYMLSYMCMYMYMYMYMHVMHAHTSICHIKRAE